MSPDQLLAASQQETSEEHTRTDLTVLTGGDAQAALAALACPPSPLLPPSEWEGLDADDLRRMLAEAHQLIRERERELTLAAEIGRNLVAENATLKQRCQDLAKRQRSVGRAGGATPRRSTTPRRAGGPHISITNSPSITPVTEEPDDHDLRSMTPDIASAVHGGHPLTLDSSTHTLLAEPTGHSVVVSDEEHFSGDAASSMRRPTPRRAFGARTPAHPDADIIADLERQNTELQARIEQSQLDAEQARKASARRAKKSEQESASTRRELERAHERVRELEEEMDERKLADISSGGSGNGGGRRGRHMRRSRTHAGIDADHSDYDYGEDYNGSRDGGNLADLDSRALRRRLQDLDASHSALAATKRIVNERLVHAQSELRAARQRNQELESRLRTQQHLEEEYEQQSAHMMQLEKALDEQRRYARGDYSPALQARSPDLTAEGLRRRGKNLMDEFERGRSLMDEFEMVLFRGTDPDAADGGAQTEADTMGPSGVDTLFNALAGAARAGVESHPLAGGFMLDDLVGAVGQAAFGASHHGGGGSQAMTTSHHGGGSAALSAYNEDRSFFGLLRGLLVSLWRWFRFLCVLWCAVVVSVYRGPPKVITTS